MSTSVTLPHSAEFQKRVFSNIPLLLGGVLIIGDVISILIASHASIRINTFLKSHLFLDPEFIHLMQSDSISQKLFFVLAAMTTCIFWGGGLYTNRTPWWNQVNTIAKITIFTFILHVTIGIALESYEPELLIFTNWLLAFVFITLSRSFTYRLAFLLPYWRIPTIIISDSVTAEDLVYAFSSDIGTGYDIKGIFLRNRDDKNPFDESVLSPAQRSVLIRYGQENYDDFINHNPEMFYIVSLDTFLESERESILKILNNKNIPYAIVPTLSKANMYQMEPKYFFGHDVVMLCVDNSAPRILGISLARFLKRGLDILVAGSGLIIASPFLILVAVMLKLEGQNGSIFYGGKRIGKNGTLFNCWKFRSMEPESDHLLTSYLAKHPDAQIDWEKYRKLPNDPRITTKTAYVIRKTSLDEVPQLWNIFVGDMSLVGPRPILENETHYFDEDTLKEYLSVRPGLTGLWQVSGRNKTSFKRRVYWDSWYVRNWSFWGDIVILIKTPIALLTRKGAS